MIVLVIIQVDAKQVQKRSDVEGVVPTIPSSEDHTDGTWIGTDIYSGEFFLNEFDNKLYIRSNQEILQVGFSNGLKKDVYSTEGNTTSFTTSSPVNGEFVVFEDGTVSNRTFSKSLSTRIVVEGEGVPSNTNIIIIY